MNVDRNSEAATARDMTSTQYCFGCYYYSCPVRKCCCRPDPIRPSIPLLGPEHVGRNDPFVKVFAGQVAQLQGALFQSRSLLVGVLRDGGGLSK